MSSKTYVLGIEIRSEDGHRLRTTRVVDTPAQADAIAWAGQQLDALDHATSTYTLDTWCNETDRSDLVDRKMYTQEAG